jgi:diacylglycerol O-acyltransferase / wax synthase
VDARSFDLDQHVRELPLEPPAGEAELVAAIESLRRQRLVASRPMWEMWFLTGLPDRRVGLFVKLHHTIADGIAAMTTLTTFLDPSPMAEVVPPRAWAPAPVPSTGELIEDGLGRSVRAMAARISMLARPGDTVRRMRAAWPAVREIVAEEPANETSLDRMVGPDRNLAFIHSDFRAVRRIGRTFDATVNDVLLAMTASGLRALIHSRSEPVDDTTVRIYVPVSLRHRLRGVQEGNRIAQMAVPLRLGEDDPVRRLTAIAAETASRKARMRTSLGALLFGGPFVRRLMLWAVLRQRVNATSASIPGPRSPLYLAGSRALDVFPVLPLVANEPLGVGAMSYAGRWNIGVTADREAFPDVDVLVAGMREELRALSDVAHVPLPDEPGLLAVPIAQG